MEKQRGYSALSSLRVMSAIFKSRRGPTGRPTGTCKRRACPGNSNLPAVAITDITPSKEGDDLQLN